MDVDDVGNASGGFDGAGGVGSLCADGSGCGGGGLGTGCDGASVGAVACGVGVGGMGGGWEGGCFGKFSWNDCWSSLVMWSVKEVRSSSLICSKYCWWFSDCCDGAEVEEASGMD